MRALVLSVLLAALLLLLGCQQSARSPNEVLLWTGFESELPTLHQLARDFQAESGTPVRIVKVPFSRLRDKYLIAAPAGQGPDLLIGPQDWVGILKTAGLLEPMPAELMPAELRRQMLPVTLEAMTLDGQLYAMPMVAQCVALIRNPELVPKAPQSLDEMVAMAQAVREGGRYGLYYELENLYFSWPFFAAYGAVMFEDQDVSKPRFDSPEAVEAATFLRGLRQDGLVPPEATTDLSKSLFLEGRAGMILNGPWFLKDLREGKVPYAIDAIPGRDGRAASPLVTVEGLMLNNRAVARDSALRFAAFMGRPGSQARVALASGRTPAHRQALEEAARDPEVGPNLQAFARVVEQGIPMPNHPAVSAVWEPMEAALDLIAKGQVQPGPQLAVTQKTIERKIRQMME